MSILLVLQDSIHQVDIGLIKGSSALSLFAYSVNVNAPGDIGNKSNVIMK